jgi:septum formation protein
LQQLGIQFEVVTPEVEELEEGLPEEVAVENAIRKATAAATAAGTAVPILGVDTIVHVDSRIYGKPRDAEQARATLEALSGRSHTVIGGICLIEERAPRTAAVRTPDARTAAVRTRVEFRSLSEALIEWYLTTGEWRERAGAYAIQGRGGALVREIEGDYLNVVGLPLSTLLDLAPWLLGAGVAEGF